VTLAIPKPEKRKRTRRRLTPNPVNGGLVLDAFYQVIHEQPCLACGNTPVEAAHFAGMVSLKGGLKPRGHKLPQAFCAIPLCRNCHQGKSGIHGSKERDWLDERIPGGFAGAQGTALRLLAEAIMWVEGVTA
jgi:hypothetical protein